MSAAKGTARRTRLPGHERSHALRHFWNAVFVALCITAATMSVVVLLVLLGSILGMGLPYLDVEFLTSAPSRKPEDAGILPAMIGSVWICGLCGLFALPIGVATAILLEEFPPRHPWVRRLHSLIQLNITNLAGVPSIVYGIIGLAAFAQMFEVFGSPLNTRFTFGTREDPYYLQLPFGRGILAGGLTLMLVILPIVIVAAQESLRAVPDSLRKGALAMGATRWQTVQKITLPAAVPGIMTGSILAMSRAIGEAAPVLILAGTVFIRFTPNHLMSEFSAMPLQIFDWARKPKDEFHSVAAAGIIVLLVALLSFNALAIFLRHRLQKPLQ